DAQLRFPPHGPDRHPAKGDARFDGHVARVHAIERAAAQARGTAIAVAVAGSFARGGCFSSFRARRGAIAGQELTRSAAAAPSRAAAPGYPVRGAVGLLSRRDAA